MPLNQVATINVPEPRMITVQVWDRSQVGAVERPSANPISALNPMVDGQLMRLPIPELNQERRQEMAKIAHKYAEQARIAVRNVRRDGMEHLKKLEKDGEMARTSTTRSRQGAEVDRQDHQGDRRGACAARKPRSCRSNWARPEERPYLEPGAAERDACGG